MIFYSLLKFGIFEHGDTYKLYPYKKCALLLVCTFILLLLFILSWEGIHNSINPYRPDPGRRGKIDLNFYFHTSLWYLKRFYEGLKGHKTF